MQPEAFRTADGRPLTALTADEMRGVDRVAVEDVGLELLGMMENAGRNLAAVVRGNAGSAEDILVLASEGGNGGGGLVCARHLLNHGRSVAVVLDRASAELTGAVATQHDILATMDVPVTVAPETLPTHDLVVDALVGYGLSGPLQGVAAELVEEIPATSTVVSLDVPTGLAATRGTTPGVAVSPDTVVTLALPKTGLTELACPLRLADIAVPAVVYDRLDIPYTDPFDGSYSIPISPQPGP